MGHPVPTYRLQTRWDRRCEGAALASEGSTCSRTSPAAKCSSPSPTVQLGYNPLSNSNPCPRVYHCPLENTLHSESYQSKMVSIKINLYAKLLQTRLDSSRWLNGVKSTVLMTVVQFELSFLCDKYFKVSIKYWTCL